MSSNGTDRKGNENESNQNETSPQEGRYMLYERYSGPVLYGFIGVVFLTQVYLMFVVHKDRDSAISSDVVRAEEFVLQDAEGNVRGNWETGLFGSSMKFKGKEKEKPRIQLSVLPEHSRIIMRSPASAETREHVRLDAGGSSQLQLVSPEVGNNVNLRSDGLFMQDGTSSQQIALSLEDTPELRFIDENDHTRVKLGAMDRTYFRLHDRTGTTRIKMDVGRPDRPGLNPKLYFYNSKGGVTWKAAE